MPQGLTRGLASLAAVVAAALALPAPAPGSHRFVLPVSEGPADSEAPAGYLASTPDGAAVLFTTEEALTADDADATADIYLRRGSSLTLVSAPAPGFASDSGEPAAFRVATPDLTHVVFETRQIMASGDDDGQTDLYEFAGGETRLLSTSPEPSLISFYTTVLIAPDGDHVLFSANEPLTSDDNDSRTDVYDSSGGQLTLVSSGFSNEHVSLGALAPDETRVVLLTRATYPGAGDTDLAFDIYEKAGDARTLLTPGTAGEPIFRQVSSDGGHVFFESDESLAAGDADARRDVYERTGGTTVLVSTSASTPSGDFDVDFMRASDDGSRVVFATQEGLEAADTDGTEDLYLRAGAVTTRLTTANTPGVPFTTFGGMTGDGANIFFQTREQLGDDTDSGLLDAFHWHDGTVTRISVPELPPDRSAAMAGFSADASRLFFQTPGDFAEGDGDGFEDFYERAVGQTRLVTPTPAEACFPLPVPSRCEPTWHTSSADGSRVFFSSRERLHPDDVDDALDVYESRIAVAPEIDAADAALSYSEGDVVAVDATLALDDAYGELFGARVQITGGFEPGDTLAFTDQGGITGSFDAGVLTLSGRATVADYRSALRSVTFNTGDEPSAADRTVELEVDNGGHRATDTRTIAVATVNDAPVLELGATAAGYVENAAPVAIAPALVVADPDSATIAAATVRITAGFAAGEDELLAPAHPQITATPGDGGATLTLGGTAPPSAYQQVLRGVSYRNGSDDPSSATRTIALSASDGAAAGAPVSAQLPVTPVDDPTSLETTPGAAAFEEDGPPVAIDPRLDLLDPDSDTLSGATVRLSAGFAAGEDVLGFGDQGGIAGSLSSAGDTLTLTGTAPLAAYRAALRSVTYRNVVEDPSPQQRTVEFSVGGGAGPATRTVALSPVDDPPAISIGGGGAAMHTEGGAPATLAPELDIADADSAQLTRAVVRISDDLEAGTDVLSAAPPAGISADYDRASGTLTLGGRAPVADYRSALRGVAFATRSDDPSTATRTVSFRALDTGAGPDAAVTVGVVPTNDAPSVRLAGGPLSHRARDAAVPIDPALAVADPDSPTLTGARVRIVAGARAADELVAQERDDGIALSRGADGRSWTLAGTASLSAYRDALRTFAFRTDDGGERTVEVVVSDGSLESAAATRTIAATPGAPPPLLCARAIVLTDVTPIGRRVRLGGVARIAYAGEPVEIRARGRVVARATVRSDGTFRTRARRPRGAHAARTRYRAIVAGQRSAALKLVRALVLTGQRRAGDRVRVSGRLRGSRGVRRRLTVDRHTGCSRAQITRVATVRTRRDGTFTVALDRPSRPDTLAVYRVRAPRLSTYSLPIVLRHSR